MTWRGSRRAGAGQGSSRAARRTVAAGLASYLDASLLITVSVALPLWEDQHELSLAQIGLLTSGLSLAFALGAALGGRLADRFGRELMFTLDLLVLVVGVLLVAVAWGPAPLTVGVVLAGLSAGADLPTSLALVASAAPPSARGGPVGSTQLFWSSGLVVTYALAFAVSTLGSAGTLVLLLHLLLVAVVTLVLRLRLRGSSPPAEARAISGAPAADEPLVLAPLVLTGGFYLLWNVAATTIATYGTYFLVTQIDLTQTQATAAVVFTIPPVLLGLAFVRLADTPWRDRLFPVAAALQVTAFVVGALTGAESAVGIAVLLTLWSLSNIFGGEAVYRVWSQLLLRSSRRAADFGLTYGSARILASAFLLVVPFLIDRHPAGLLWILAACLTVSGALGVVVVRRLHRPATVSGLPVAARD